MGSVGAFTTRHRLVFKKLYKNNGTFYDGRNNIFNKCDIEKMIKNCMLFLMRKDINPTWEDEKNCKGGCFSFKVMNKQVSDVWNNCMYALTGESISKEKKFIEKVNGMTISPKKTFCIY